MYGCCQVFGFYNNIIILSHHKSLFCKCLTYVRSEVFMAVTLKNAVFWDVTPCGVRTNRRFGKIYRLHHQGDKYR
jgi:hypothetical protein